jgi:hypothetical protein
MTMLQRDMTTIHAVAHLSNEELLAAYESEQCFGLMWVREGVFIGYGAQLGLDRVRLEATDEGIIPTG